MTANIVTANIVTPNIVTPNILFVCTGNATRSILAATYTAHARPSWQVASAGTMALEGQYLSRRTIAAFESVQVPVPRHRSRALNAALLGPTDAVLCFEREHLDFIRRVHGDFADRAVLLRDAATALEPPGTQPLRARIAAVAAAPPGADVIDPGGLGDEVYIAVAREIVALLDEALPRLGPADI